MTCQPQIVTAYVSREPWLDVRLHRLALFFGNSGTYNPILPGWSGRSACNTAVPALEPLTLRSPMLDETQQQSLVTRLNRIEAQVRGIRRMVQEPRVSVD